MGMGTLEVSDGVIDIPFEIIAQVDDDDYSWSVFAVVKREDGALFVVTDSGCSCSYFGESLTVADLVPIEHFGQALWKCDKDDRERLARSYKRNEIEYR